MALFLTVLQIVAPVFLLALIGVVWVKLGYEYRVAFVTRLAMTIGVPALIFTSLMKTEIERGALFDVVWASCAAYAAVTVVFFVLVKLGRLDVQTFLAPLIFGNTGNLGLPLALFAFGEVGLGYAVVIFAVMGIYSFTFGIWLVSGGGSPLKVIKEPLVGATLLGGLFMVQGWQTPIWLTNTLELIGQMAIPLMLITLGVALARLTPENVIRAVVLSLVKVVICAGLAFGIGQYFELAPVALAVLVLQVSTPVAVTSYLLAEKYGAESGEVAGLVVVSTLLSVVTIPITLAFLV
ncbi:AEC family transporter [Amylibacter sp. IMCC11727]|uniref:AEC family transporter n=1 Tax=Amylibacter sp. IMCC11727 TaxID=3039851 RepID=UPI00244DDF8F|nr:AEC family transporter [Amylibacter sp. IMCC11727]WGI22207.1 AEC family transporter [Amylibacter sp. IMCC11727]